jgi:hypothetical protein
MYDSDMLVYVGKGNPVVEKNIALMKQLAESEQSNATHLKAK